MDDARRRRSSAGGRCASRPSRCTLTGRRSICASSTRRGRSARTFVWERVTDVTTTAGRVAGCATATGRRVEARWYIDASGTARVLSRAMGIPTIDYGRPKVCLWTYFETPPLHDGTAFFIDNRDAYLSWVWDIPISPTQTSVGFVLPAETVRARRRAGEHGRGDSPRRTGASPAVSRPARRNPAAAVESTSFQPYVTATVCGPNWLMIGEAAVDARSADRQWRHLRHASRPSCRRRHPCRRRRRRDRPAAPSRLRPARLPARSRVQRAHRERGLSSARCAGVWASRRRPTSTRSSRSS